MLPAPNLDDRSFQSLVDDAKRLVQQNCPEWTDHNVSDPGVTLIETFAYMVDQMLWRLNRVPDRNYVKFLDLLGVRLRSPAAARAPITFWLSAPQQATIDVPTGSLVATARSESEPVVFSTVRDLAIVPCSFTFLASDVNGEQLDETDGLARRDGVPVYGADHVPQPGDAFYVGLSNAVPSCVVTLRFECRTAGLGVDPRYPPIRWEAWTGEGWARCELEDDGTGGLNWAGDVVLHLPATHEAHAGVVRQAAGWLRCVIVEAESWQPAYTASPVVTGLQAFTSGGTVDGLNAEVVLDEVLGESEGVPAQRLALRNRPVVAGDRPLDHVVEVAGPEGWERWTQVEDFASSSPDDRHFVLDETAGEVSFGPAVREPDGTLRRYGAVPPKSTIVRIRSYRTGGGERGNVARGAVTVLKSSIPYIDRVSNRAAAVGGTNGEDVENAKLRGPLLLRTRQRAVTPEDYENLAMAAAPEVARVRCVPAGDVATGNGQGVVGGEDGVRVLIVPHAEDDANKLEFHQLMLGDATYERVARYLDERRAIGARVVVQPPNYVGLTVVTRIQARPDADVRALERDAMEALFGYFHPLRGGPEGKGWPFGRSVVGGEVYVVLQRCAGVEFVEEVRLFPANPVERTRRKQVDRLGIGPHELVFSWGHQVMVQS